MLPNHQKFAACEIYSSPEIKARDAVPPKNPEDKGQPARRAHPPRRGILPIGKTQFERLRKAGKFPAHDSQLNGRPMWSGKLLNEFLAAKDS